MTTSAIDIAAQAALLLDQAAQDSWALLGPSIYETGRLISDAPWLGGHRARVDYLLAEQAQDGAWGGTGFRLVPTLSATEGLLAEFQRDIAQGATLMRAAKAGISALHRMLGDRCAPLPDLVAVELVVPRLIDLINEAVHRLKLTDAPALMPPPDADAATLARVRGATQAGMPIPPKLWHSWEIIGSGRPCDPAVEPAGHTVGCSPAATAAWLGANPDLRHPSVRYLETIQRRYDGPLPVGAPMPFFERSWVINLLHTHRVPHQTPPSILDSLETALGEDGAPAGDGLPVDADDTAAVLLALQTSGRGRRPDPLMRYFDGERFFTYPKERTASPTANAHAIEALGARLAEHPNEAQSYAPALRSTAVWLTQVQGADGSWGDKWHGSRFYATATCVNALHKHGGPQAVPAIERSVSWIVSQRHDNGLWGHDDGTEEETAYAAWILLLARTEDERIAGYLRQAARILASARISARSTSLWIGKDVYTPIRIVEATCLSVLHRLRTELSHED